MAMNLSSIGLVALLITVFLWKFIEDPLYLGWTPAPSVIYVNARIWTGDGSTGLVEAMAIRNARVVELGTRQKIEATAGRNTQVVNLGGAFVTPGFIDSHVHFLEGGLQLSRLDLRACNGREDIAKKLALAVQGAESDSAWIQGWGWSEADWGGQQPDITWIDSVAPYNPVWLERIDGHMGLANSAALSLANITASSLDPKEGAIVRFSNGEPSGLLKDAAMTLVSALIPAVSLQQRRAALQVAMDHALAHGVTAVVDFGRYAPGVSPHLVWDDLNDVYSWADENGLMRMRVYAGTPLQTWERLAARISEKGHQSSQWLRWGIVKEFADGSLGSWSALFYEPYSDAPGQYGIQVADPAYLKEAVLGASLAGLQVAIHAIGDKAVDTVLDVYDSISQQLANRHLRLRVEHIQHLSPGAAARAGRIPIISSVQPQHCVDDLRFMEARIGPERMSRAYSYHSLLYSGSNLTLGSDWTVAPLDPLSGMLAAVKRKPPAWTKPFNPKEAISSYEALHGYTSRAAYSSFWEAEIGTLEVGKFADFVVLAGNPASAIDYDEMLPEIFSTYVGGSLAYEKKRAMSS